MKKITLISTGGTICSIMGPHATALNQSSRPLTEEIDQLTVDLMIQTEIISPMNKNSESLCPSDWIKLLQCLEGISPRQTNGVLITHGTDTMVYSMAAVEVFQHRWRLPICFTGSFLPPDHPRSDALLNLRTAMGFLSSGRAEPGIYLAFRSRPDNSQAGVYPGRAVKPMDFDSLCFKTLYNEAPVAVFDPVESRLEWNEEKGGEPGGLKYGKPVQEEEEKPVSLPTLTPESLPDAAGVSRAREETAFLQLYPGMGKRHLENFCKEISLLVLQGYHSGTGPADEEYGDLLEFLLEHRDLTLMIGSLPGRFITKPYNSTLKLRDAGALIYRDLQPSFIYVFSLLARACGCSNEEIRNKLKGFELQ